MTRWRASVVAILLASFPGVVSAHYPVNSRLGASLLGAARRPGRVIECRVSDLWGLVRAWMEEE
jgi:hypothetical protein